MPTISELRKRLNQDNRDYSVLDKYKIDDTKYDVSKAFSEGVDRSLLRTAFGGDIVNQLEVQEFKVQNPLEQSQYLQPMQELQLDAAGAQDVDVLARDMFSKVLQDRDEATLQPEFVQSYGISIPEGYQLKGYKENGQIKFSVIAPEGIEYQEEAEVLTDFGQAMQELYPEFGVSEVNAVIEKLATEEEPDENGKTFLDYFTETLQTRGRDNVTESILRGFGVDDEYMRQFFGEVDAQRIAAENYLRQSPNEELAAKQEELGFTYAAQFSREPVQVYSDEAINEFFEIEPTEQAVSEWFVKYRGRSPGAELSTLMSYKTGETIDNRLFLNKASDVLAAGYGDMAKSISGGLRWLGYSDTFELPGKDFDLSEFSEQAYRIAGEQPEGTGWVALRSAPTTLGLMAGGLLAAVAGGEVAATTGAGAFTTWVMSVLGPASGSRVVESFMEAGGSYDELVEKYGEAEAKERAGNLFKNNMSLAGMDVLQLTVALSPLPGGFGRALSSSKYLVPVRIGGKVGFEMLTEGGEEAVQEIFQRIEMGEDIELDDEMRTAIFVGALYGGVLGVGGDVVGTITQKTRANLSDEGKAELDELIAQGMADGYTETVAQAQSLEVISQRADEYFNAVDKAINDTEVKSNIPSAAELKTEQAELQAVLQNEKSGQVSELIDKTGWS